MAFNHISSAWLFECDWEQNGNNEYKIKSAKY